MTKTHTSMKAIRNNWRKVNQCGYCDLQYIMNGKDPWYYNSGVYGWNCDVYTNVKHDIAITTGYRNMTGKLIPAELIKKYSNRAEEMLRDAVGTSWEEIRDALEKNREDFFDELATI